jgi:dTDP-4-amino-4,6-dideoxygalactose transaminase
MHSYQVLEKEFSKFSGKKYATAVNSGTSALHLALLSLGIGLGDEVIVPDLTFAACAFSVTYTGAKPVFVDVKEDMTIDETRIRITKRTKAIMAVHLYGNRCNMQALKKFGLPIIEDMSEAHGIMPTGDIAIYSFQSSKIIHAEEGGMVVTDKNDVHLFCQHAKTFANDGKYYHNILAFNYRMPDAQAKLALHSLKNFKSNIAKRKNVARWYDVHIPAEVKLLPAEVPWIYPIVVTDPDAVVQEIKGARRFFKPMTSLPMYAQKVDHFWSYFYSNCGVVLPIRPDMKEWDVRNVVKYVII